MAWQEERKRAGEDRVRDVERVVRWRFPVQPCRKKQHSSLCRPADLQQGLRRDPFPRSIFVPFLAKLRTFAPVVPPPATKLVESRASLQQSPYYPLSPPPRTLSTLVSMYLDQKFGVSITKPSFSNAVLALTEQ